MVIQGREVEQENIHLIYRLLRDNPQWCRTRLSKELCTIWNWRAASGLYKDMACRSMLLKLEKLGHIKLPPRVRVKNNLRRNNLISHERTPVECALKDIMPVKIVPVGNFKENIIFSSLLFQYHYLGYSGPVGENMKYLVFNRDDRALACLLFGSCAWSIKPRDEYIGWDTRAQRDNLWKITNNMRYLILPWVRVKNLASHILSLVARRIMDDWISKYRHPVYMLETFVDRSRFHGTSYRAANWIYVGQTKGRSRNDRYNNIRVPVKDIYLYPLSKNFREELVNGS